MKPSVKDNSITIVIPVFNRAKILRRTLDAVAAQTWRPLNVVLVDNNSTDESMQVLNDWKQGTESQDFNVKVVREKRPGASAARNCGLRNVKTEWTMFFDSDDIMIPEHVEKAMRFAESRPDADIIGWDRAINFLDGRRLIRRFYDDDCDFHNVFHSIFSTESYMARTELFRKARGWDESVRMGDDIELGQRLLAFNPTVYKADGPITVEVQESGQSISSESGIKIKSFVKAYESIRSRLPKSKKHWVDLRYIVLATNEARQDEDSPEFVAEILRRTPLRRRMLWQALYLYSQSGGRGVAAIYKLMRWTGL